MFYFLAFTSGSVLSGNAFRYIYGYRYRFCVLGLFKSLLAHIQARYGCTYLTYCNKRPMVDVSDSETRKCRVRLGMHDKEVKGYMSRNA